MNGNAEDVAKDDTGTMARFDLTYVSGNTPVHRLDARVKIVALLVYSVAILAVPTWWALGIFAVLLLGALVVSKLPAGLMARSLVPVFVLAGFSLVFNVVAVPSFDGLSTGAFVAVRMVALVASSFVVCFTTTPSELLHAFRKLIAPLGRLHVPVDDIALVLALSVRFIPVVEQEFERIRTAQKARGAEATGSFSRKLKVWGMAFNALFINLFRHADNLSDAMDARCYGTQEKRTALPHE